MIDDRHHAPLAGPGAHRIIHGQPNQRGGGVALRGFPPGTTRTVQILTDGDKDLARYVPELFPDAIHTLDVMHVIEKLPKPEVEELILEEVPDISTYRARFGITAERAARLRDDVPLLHPGPMNRGVEISAEVADLPRTVIIDQVRNGVAVRMAVLYLLSGGKPELAERAKGGE